MRELNEVRVDLQDRNLKEVSRRTGIKYGTLYTFVNGTSRPLYEVVKTLEEYLQGGGNDGGE